MLANDVHRKKISQSRLDTPSVQTGAGGVWLNVKFWVSDSSAATMQTAVLTDNSLQGADNGLQITAEVAQREPVAV
jgi:hypothetical protein